MAAGHRIVSLICCGSTESKYWSSCTPERNVGRDVEVGSDARSRHEHPCAKSMRNIPDKLATVQVHRAAALPLIKTSAVTLRSIGYKLCVESIQAAAPDAHASAMCQVRVVPGYAAAVKGHIALDQDTGAH